MEYMYTNTTRHQQQLNEIQNSKQNTHLYGVPLNDM